MTDTLTTPAFKAFPKLPRLRREVIATEKIDGTNACIGVIPKENRVALENLNEAEVCETENGDLVWAQSRKRIITPGKSTDNYGFAGWVHKHAEVLAQLGAGYHYGEWWGVGINRGYGHSDSPRPKTFSLFNPYQPLPLLGLDGVNPTRINLPMPDGRPAVLTRVPILAQGDHISTVVHHAEIKLRLEGSQAAPGYMKPEGVVVYHTAGRVSFKTTLENDGVPKGQVQG